MAMNIRDIIKDGSYEELNKQLSVGSVRATLLRMQIEVAIRKWADDFQKQLDGMKSDVEADGIAKLDDCRNVTDRLRILVHPIDFISTVIPTLEFDSERELTFVLFVAIERYNKIYDDLPDNLKEAMHMLQKEAALNADGVDAKFTVILTKTRVEDLNLSKEGVSSADGFHHLQICSGASGNEWDEPVDLLCFDVLECFPAKLKELLSKEARKEDCGHIHIDKSTCLFMTCKKKSEFSVFSLSEMDGDSLIVDSGIMGVMSSEEMKRINPTFKFNPSRQIMIKNYEGAISINDGRMEGDKDLLINTVKK